MKKSNVTYQIDDFFIWWWSYTVSYENDATKSADKINMCCCLGILTTFNWELIVVIIRMIILSTRQLMLRTSMYYKIALVQYDFHDDDDDVNDETINFDIYIGFILFCTALL